MSSDDLFTAPQVAKICSTDLKTIHNWVGRGEIRYFRTPGRHLRFRRQDILDFLNRFGYPVPEGFAPARHRAVIIDAEAQTASSIAQAIEGELEVKAYADYFEALLHIGREKPSLVLVNCASDPEMLRVVQNLSKSDEAVPVLTYGGDEDQVAKTLAAGARHSVAGKDVASVRSKVVSIVKDELKTAS